ncbi:unnamed protein product [Rotaria sp. Silwood2]|nr:unnamed protein product [Rotaria sp. Silwood2]CAF4125879.1 unnamed protein product [Rotaria sp. Silwood2]CAF4391310.1 unnamed protein product [Rotaria sp. Silwood2]
MRKFDAAKAVFEQIDTNRDGNIDKNEVRQWVSNAEGLPSSSHESSTSERILHDNTTSRFDRNKYEVSCQNASEYTADKYISCGSTAVASEMINDTVIRTNSSEETNQYLEKSANNIYKDPNPQIIRRATTECPVTYEQRVSVRYLQPPAVPPPGPLIIKEVRPPQSPPPRPLVVRQHAPPLPSPPPLILRERPPTPPTCVPSETVTRCLPAIPVPPRSVVIERIPSLPEKPRKRIIFSDIIIERWIPYGPQPERRTITERAPPAIIYPEPRNRVVVYEATEARTVRKFQNLGVVQENPADYVVRYGTSLLDTATLVQQARNAGVIEDISPPVLSSSMYTNIRGNTDFGQSNEIISRDFSLSGGTGCAGTQLATGTQGINRGNTSYSSSASNCIGDSAVAINVRITLSGFHGCDANLTATDTYRDRQLKQEEFQRYI